MLLSYLKYNHLMTNKPIPLVIGVAGGSGSGKTTVAEMVLKRVGSSALPISPMMPITVN